MSYISPYLTFSGNCREAMLFYQEAIGGELALQTLGDSPFGNKMPCHLKSYIMHATLTRGQLVLTGTDLVTDRGLYKGNSVSLLLHCGCTEELQETYARLARGGKVTSEPQVNYSGALFGDLIDRFGNHWLLQSEAE
jgi:PhnB protein